jgi:hypothetical protein
MNVVPLPSQQEAFNIKMNRRVKSLLLASALCLLGGAALVTAAWWIGPHRGVTLPSVLGPDNMFLGSATIVTQDFALCATENVPPGSFIEIDGKFHIAVDVVRTETITNETKITLLRLRAPLPGNVTPLTLSEATTGAEVEAASTEMAWKGTISETKDGIFQTQPALLVAPGAPVQDEVTHVMVGLTGRMNANGAVVSSQRLMKAFPELGRSR